jgi:hypothetical protein
VRPDEWKKLFELRDDLEGEDRTLVRKLIRYVEELEQEMRNLKALLLRKKGQQDEHCE